MHRPMVVIIIVLVVFLSFFAWAEADSPHKMAAKKPGEKEHARQAVIKPKKPLSKGSVGRFQAVTLDKNSAIILDTEKGHLWMWRLGINTISLTYAGQVYPGKDVADVIYETSLKTK